MRRSVASSLRWAAALGSSALAAFAAALGRARPGAWWPAEQLPWRRV
ncbi:hypothetical protein [Ideonella paludis]